VRQQIGAARERLGAATSAEAVRIGIGLGLIRP
jgi:hypothetical protein